MIIPGVPNRQSILLKMRVKQRRALVATKPIEHAEQIIFP
jgi:hypothetical protein